jgi:protein TonB
MEELANARSEQRVDETIALASARLEEGDLLSPANDNARYYYELVLSSDPSNTEARQGLNVIASKLVLQARSEIDAGNFDSAARTLANARAIDASNAELTSTESALQSARDAVAQRERQAAEARARAEADRIAETERQAAAQRATDESRTAEQSAAAAATATAQTSVAAEPPAQAVTAPAESKAQAEDVSAARASEAPAQTVETPAQPVPVSEQQPVAISTLTRTKYVAPRYPRAAQRRGESGWVDIVFTVALDGTVKDVEARDSQPEGTFENAAIRAVEKWTFEPVIENGQAVEKRAGVRMMFALE